MSEGFDEAVLKFCDRFILLHKAGMKLHKGFKVNSDLQSQLPAEVLRIRPEPKEMKVLLCE